jgi:hypothetical protein
VDCFEHLLLYHFLGRHPLLLAAELLLTLITGSMLLSERKVKFSLESYALSARTLFTLKFLDTFFRRHEPFQMIVNGYDLLDVDGKVNLQIAFTFQILLIQNYAP